MQLVQRELGNADLLVQSDPSKAQQAAQLYLACGEALAQVQKETSDDVIFIAGVK